MFLSTRQAQQTIEEHTENIGSPRVAIEPQFQARIQKAVDLINQKSPGVLSSITDIIGQLDSGPFGRFTTNNPHTIYVNIPKLESEIKSRLAGQPDNVIQQELDNQIVKTIMHEATHQKEVEQTGYSSEGGADAAEKQAENFLEPIQLQSMLSYRRADVLERLKSKNPVAPVEPQLTLHMDGYDGEEIEDDNHPHNRIVKTPEEAAKAYRKFIEDGYFTSEDAPQGFVCKDGEPYLRISYNGRLWNLDDTPYK